MPGFCFFLSRSHRVSDTKLGFSILVRTIHCFFVLKKLSKMKLVIKKLVLLKNFATIWFRYSRFLDYNKKWWNNVFISSKAIDEFLIQGHVNKYKYTNHDRKTFPRLLHTFKANF